MDLNYQESIEVAASPDEVYDLVSDVTRTGEWSPVCRECWWDQGDRPRVGARFTGRNVTPERSWETVSTVTVAEPGTEFVWEVAQGFVRWGYRLEPSGEGTRLTESWEFTPAGQEHFRTRFGDEAPAKIDEATRAARGGIPATLAAIKRIAEVKDAVVRP